MSEEKKMILTNRLVIPVSIAVGALITLIPGIAYIANLRSDVNYLKSQQDTMQQIVEALRNNGTNTSERVIVLEAQYQTILSSLNEIKETLKSR